jgi:hypothetical protein
MWREDVLEPKSAALLERKAKPSSLRAIDVLPPRPSIRFTYVTSIKEAGETYFVYRHHKVLRFIPAFAQAPKVLFTASVKALGDSDEPLPLASKLGRARLSPADRQILLVDHPKEPRLLVSPVLLPEAATDRAAVEAEVSEAEAEFMSRHGPEFHRWFESASDAVRNEDGTPKVFFRGQTKTGFNSRLVLDSFTDSPDIASVYSTSGGVVQEGSNVIPVLIDVKNPLVIKHGWLTFYDFLKLLDYEPWGGKGITHEESLKVLNYLANRKKASESAIVPQKLKSFEGMPSFKYQVLEEGPDDEDSVDLSIYRESFFTDPLNLFRTVWNDYEDEDEDTQKSLAMQLAVDTYALVETPAAVRALVKLGYDGVWHRDQFAAKSATKTLLNKELADLKGVEDGTDDDDFNYEEMSYEYGHMTLRPLRRSQVWPLLSSKPLTDSDSKKTSASAVTWTKYSVRVA